MATDFPRFTRLAKNAFTPAPLMVAVPTFVLSWASTGFSQSAQYYKLTVLRKSRNSTAVWEGQSTGSAEQTLPANANANTPRAVVTPGSDADGFSIYQSLASGTEKFWAEVRITRDANGNITGAAIESGGAGTISATTATTVTWDGPSGLNPSAPGGNAAPPTVDKAELDYLVLTERAFLESAFWKRVGVTKELADGTQMYALKNHVAAPNLRVETTTEGGATDMRKLLSWTYVRMRLLPDTYWGRSHDAFIDSGALEDFLTQWEAGPRKWVLSVRGIAGYTEPPDPIKV